MLSVLKDSGRSDTIGKMKERTCEMLGVFAVVADAGEGGGKRERVSDGGRMGGERD